MSGSVFNLTIEDTSPTLQYVPEAEGGGPDGGWATYYETGGYVTVNGAIPRGDTGVGASYHITTHEGSTVSLKFHGTAVYLYGQANCTYDVVLDNKSSNGTFAGPDLLSAVTGLQSGDHIITLAPHPANGGMFFLDKALITVDLGAGVAFQHNVFPASNTSVAFNPPAAWVTKEDGGIPSPFMQTQVQDASVSLNFTGRAVAIYSHINWGHDRYTVTLDGFKTQLNGSSYWKVNETVRFFCRGS